LWQRGLFISRTSLNVSNLRWSVIVGRFNHEIA
jgi:hypothetical protein